MPLCCKTHRPSQVLQKEQGKAGHACIQQLLKCLQVDEQARSKAAFGPATWVRHLTISSGGKHRIECGGAVQAASTLTAASSIQRTSMEVSANYMY